jgi:hypothetical protein
MILAAPPIDGCAVNDLDAINAIVTHPGVYGEIARVPSIAGVLILTIGGVLVQFAEVKPRIHESHIAIAPEWRGARAVRIMRAVRDWWWRVQPSDLMLAPIRRENARARHFAMQIGFRRMNVLPMTSNDGIVRDYVTYRMDRP